MNGKCIIVTHVAKRLGVLTVKPETRSWYSPSQYPKLFRGNSLVTNEMAKIDKYSIYSLFGNNFDYTTSRHEITAY